MSYSKITTQDVELAEEFFDNNKHLDEFLSNVIRYYSGKELTIKTKIVKKYFNTYKKTMDFIIRARHSGKEGGLKTSENKVVAEHTLIGSLGGVVQGSLEGSLGGVLVPNIKDKVISKKSNSKEKIINENSFEELWILYGKKGNRKTSFDKLSKLKIEDIEAIKKHIPIYVNSVSDKQYLKNFETYLTQRHWETEIVLPLKKEYNKISETGVKVLGKEVTPQNYGW